MDELNLPDPHSLYQLAKQPINRREVLDFMNQYGFKVSKSYEPGETDMIGADAPRRFLGEMLYVKKLPVIFLGDKGRLWLLMPDHYASTYSNRDYHTSRIVTDSLGDLVQGLIPIVSLAFKERAIPDPVDGIPLFIQEKGNESLLKEFERRYCKTKPSQKQSRRYGPRCRPFEERGSSGLHCV